MDHPFYSLQPTYDPRVFTVSSVEDAKRVIVTPEPGTTSEERWKKETPFLVEDIGKHLGLSPEMTLVDYGCGVGRIAKGLIERYGCRVVGVDFSPTMRRLAPEYVGSDQFVVSSVGNFDQMIAGGFRADAAVCVWVLQHVLEVADTVRRLALAVRPGGLLYALNSGRCVPTDRGWMNDAVDIFRELGAVFQELSHHKLPESVTTPQLASAAVVQVLRRPA